MNKKSSQLSILFFTFTLIFLSGCSDRYYEMYKSPCACFSEKDLTKIYQQIENEELKKIDSNTKENDQTFLKEGKSKEKRC